DRELPAGGVDEPEVSLVVVTEGELVVTALEEAIRLLGRISERAAELAAPAVPRVVGVGAAAALPLGAAERGGVARPDRRVVVVWVEIGPVLNRVGVGEPPEVVV